LAAGHCKIQVAGSLLEVFMGLVYKIIIYRQIMIYNLCFFNEKTNISVTEFGKNMLL